MRKILIIGCSGLTGSKLAPILLSDYDVYGFYNKCSISRLPESHTFQQDITDYSGLHKTLVSISPDIIINLAAYNDVDGCEDHREIALAVNYQAVAKLSDIANEIGSKFISVSTDYVFDGKKEKYSEDDNVGPLNYYGYSKLLGEQFIVRNCDNFCIVRTSNLFGYSQVEANHNIFSSSGKINFGLKMLTKLSKGEQVFGATDMFITPTLADTLALGLAKIVENKTSGILHVSGLSCTDRYTYALKLAKRMGHDESTVAPILSDGLKLKAARPKKSCLCCDKFNTMFPDIVLPLEKSLDVLYAQISSFSPHLLGNKIGRDIKNA